MNLLGYNLLRPLLSNLDPEVAHRKTVDLLSSVSQSRTQMAVLSKLYRDKVPELPTDLFHIRLKNPVGLAAGFDKNGVAYPALAALGFGFVEVGTVTPKQQPGNPGVRVFRLDSEESIINRLGFNSHGLKAFNKNLLNNSVHEKPAMLGVNIGKNTDTPNHRAIDDYLTCFEVVYQHADYVTLNLSSPNSPGLRSLQQASEFKELLHAVMQKRMVLANQHAGKILPVAVKVSPDLESDQIDAIAEISLQLKVDALIATNTTTSRDASVSHSHYHETGGLSGQLLKNQATSVISRLTQATEGNIPIIGVGGVSSAEDAWEKFLAGASVLQLYTAMVFKGPAIVRQIVTGLKERAEKYDSSNFAAAVKLARQEN